jgi:Smg protein
MSDTWLGLLHVLTGRLLADRTLRRDPAPLIEELAAEGFDAADVALAVAWVERFFAGLHGAAAESAAGEPIVSSGLRTRSAEELLCLSPAAFGLLLRLEHAGVIDAAAREEILDQALALCEAEIGEDEIREISRHVLEAAGRDGSAADEFDAATRGRNLH